MPRTFPLVFVAVLLVAAPSWATSWTIGGGGGFQADQYVATRIEISGMRYPDAVFTAAGMLSGFGERPLSRRVAVRFIGGYSQYSRDVDLVRIPEEPPFFERQTLGIVSFGTTLRVRPFSGRRALPYLEAGPVLCWSRWKDRFSQHGSWLGGTRIDVDRTVRASKLLPGLGWSGGLELNPGGRFRMDVGVVGLLTAAPRSVDLPTLSREWVHGIRQYGLSASLGCEL